MPLLGFGLPVAGAWATPPVLRHVARRAEDLGYAALWTFQRVLFPVDAPVGAPAGPGLEPAHRSVLDPVVALTYVAGCTERIGLGTATICAPYTPPAVLAKALTSLDVVSGGRLTAGLGAGWLPQEYAAAGVPFDRRGARFEEYLRCLVTLWTQDPVEFRGEFWTVPLSRTGPRPVTRPHPPLLVGGTAPAMLRRAGALAQGWIGSSRHDPGRLAADVATVRAAAAGAGRDPDALRIVVRGVPDLLDRAPAGPRRLLRGTREQLLDDLRTLAAHGVTEVILDLNLAAGPVWTDAGPADAQARADAVLDALAPSASLSA